MSNLDFRHQSLNEWYSGLQGRHEMHLKKLREAAVPIPFKEARESAAAVTYVYDDSQAQPVATPKRVEGAYRHASILVPDEIDECCGIEVFGRLIRSLVFSTDVVTIRNCNADAVLSVYPFTCQPAITQALLTAAECPVFTGVAGLTTTGQRSVDLALISESQGAAGVVVNATTDPDTIRVIAARVDIPVVVTIANFDEYAQVRIASGARIVNVAAGRDTANVVEQVRQAFPDLPIMASGGRDGATIRATIAAGADAISWTPPSMADLEHQLMSKSRAILEPAAEEDFETA